MKAENNNRGFWLGLPWQRKGLMSEAVEVVTDYFFNELGFSVMRVPKAAVNTASSEVFDLKPTSGNPGIRIEFVGWRPSRN
jgi:hypothetical protein